MGFEIRRNAAIADRILLDMAVGRNRDSILKTH